MYGHPKHKYPDYRFYRPSQMHKQYIWQYAKESALFILCILLLIAVLVVTGGDHTGHAPGVIFVESIEHDIDCMHHPRTQHKLTVAGQ